MIGCQKCREDKNAMDFWFETIKIVASLVPVGVVVWQFFKTKKLKKNEKSLILCSKFFYLESLLCTTIGYLRSVLNESDSNQITRSLHKTELLKAYRLDKPTIISEISELSFECFKDMDRETVKIVQDFLGCASNTYNTINGMLEMLEKEEAIDKKIGVKKLDEMVLEMENHFNEYREKMIGLCPMNNVFFDA